MTKRIPAAALALGLAVLLGAPAAEAQQGLGPDITVAGTDSPGTYLPGQAVPVEIALQCTPYCGQNADWWIWAEQQGQVVLRYDGAAGRWVPNTSLTEPDAPSFQQALLDLPRTTLPGTLLLPPGSTTLHFAWDLPMDGVFVVGQDAAWEEDTLWLWVSWGFFEDFSDGRANRFAPTPAGRWSVRRQRYVLAPEGDPAVRLATYREGFGDFFYSAHVRTVAGSLATLRRGVGVVVRADGGYANGYVFHINARGYFTIFKRRRGVTVPLMRGWQFSPAIVRGFGRWNWLAVSAYGDQLDFFVNDSLVGTVRDATFLTGRAGVKAFGSAGDRFEFDNLALEVFGD